MTLPWLLSGEQGEYRQNRDNLHWLGERESNPYSRSQSPLSYH